MSWLPVRLDIRRPQFKRGGRYQRFGPVFAFFNSGIGTSTITTSSAPHIRDSISCRRVMIRWCVAALPCALVAMWNVGYQANRVMEFQGMATAKGWRGTLLDAIGLGYSPEAVWACILHGSLYVIPLYLVSLTVAFFWEGLFACVRRRTMDSAFLVTALLFTLTLPPDMPLWQVALGISFGIVMAKLIFGGSGRNFLNPALAARAFLYLAYPDDISGDGSWVAVDGYSGATPLTTASDQGVMGILESGVTWWDAMLGIIPGSLGETSILACLLGAAFLIYTNSGSWRIMLGSLMGLIAATLTFNLIGHDNNPMWAVPWHWHLVLGGFVFGTVFMATDPVTSCDTDSGRWIYGVLIGALTVLIRVANPLFPEGVMMAILFANVFAPLIDHFVVASNVRRRRMRNER